VKREVLLLGVARELAGCDSITLELDDDAEVRVLRAVLAREHPELAELLPSCAVAVDERYAADDAPLRGEIALIPPVSGG
jgi:molybdopterin converting factor small subunit